MRNVIDFICYAVNPRQAKMFFILLLLWALTLLVGCRSQSTAAQERYEAEIEQIKAEYEAQIAEVRAQAEAGIYATQYLSDEYLGDAWYIALWLDSLDNTYPGLTVEAKKLACWVIFNRVESSEYPDDVEGVLFQDGQFCEFSASYSKSDRPTEDNIAVAKNQLSRWVNGDVRSAPARAVYMSVSSDGVVLRDSYIETAKTSYWRA